jgi:hypothetical protein
MLKDGRSSCSIVGVVAAGVQFADVGVRVLKAIWDVRNSLEDVPENLKVLAVQLQQLLKLTENIKSNSSLKAMNADIGNDILSDCVTLVNDLQTLLDHVLVKAGDSPAWRGWKAVVSIKKEEKILKLGTRLESNKTSLIAWLSSINQLIQSISTGGL